MMILKKILVTLIIIYQKLLSPLLPRTCRFYPSCSVYALHALKEKNLGEALILILKRLLRCHPFNPGGYDPLK